MKGGRRARESGRTAAAGHRPAARRGEGADGEARRAAGRAGTGDGELAEDAAALAEALAAELASDAEERNAAEDGLYVLGKCYGCGARLQMLTPGAAGFVDSAVYETKRRHRQHNTHILCARCQGLSNNKLTSAVVGVAGVQNTDPKTFVSTPEQLRETLAELNQAKVLVVLLVDLADASGTMLPSVRDLVGGNPIILVGTKADLLPTTCEPGGVTRWLEAEARRRGLGTLAGCYLTSSSDATRPAPRRRGTADRNAFATTRMPRGNLPAVVAAIRREQRGRDVVVVGAANVGKSAFINAMLDDMGHVSSPNFDPASNEAMRAKPTVSAMPGTTLRPLPLASFSSGARLMDTPGVHLDHRMEQMLDAASISALHKSAGRSPMRSFGVGGPDDPLTGQTLFWGALVRIDVATDAPAALELRFFGPKCLHVTRVPTHAEGKAWLADALAAEAPEGGDARADPARFGAAAVARRGGFWVARELEVDLNPSPDLAALDIAPSGLGGWVRVGTARGARVAYNDSPPSAWLRISAPKGVEVFLRPPLPTTARESEELEDRESDAMIM